MRHSAHPKTRGRGAGEADGLPGGNRRRPICGCPPTPPSQIWKFFAGFSRYRLARTGVSPPVGSDFGPYPPGLWGLNGRFGGFHTSLRCITISEIRIASLCGGRLVTATCGDASGSITVRDASASPPPCTTNLIDREVFHKVQRPTGAGSRQWCGSTHWLAALPPCVGWMFNITTGFSGDPP